jgi:hypothetical protein
MSPTAVQAVADVHETPLSSLPLAPGKFGVVWSDQLVPFQCSARVISLPMLSTEFPTAVHAMDDAHETPLSMLAPFGFGVVWIDQVVPFQLSARVC